LVRPNALWPTQPKLPTRPTLQRPLPWQYAVPHLNIDNESVERDVNCERCRRRRTKLL